MGDRQVRKYQDLIAWQKAFQLGLSVYRLTTRLPDHERFGLVSQMRRCSVGVASNIAEGYGRGSTSDYTRFLKIARGALYELETQLLFAKELAYITPDSHEPVAAQLQETERVLAGLIRSLDGSA